MKKWGTIINPCCQRPANFHQQDSIEVLHQYRDHLIIIITIIIISSSRAFVDRVQKKTGCLIIFTSLNNGLFPDRVAYK